MSYISAIETSVPEYKYTQKEIQNYYSDLTDKINLKRKINIIFSKTEIRNRYSILSDFKQKTKDDDLSLFLSNQEPKLGQKMSIFRNEAKKLALIAINKIENLSVLKKNITHIITVSCTGIYSPGLDIELINELSLNPNIKRSSINFMGCNAAILALKEADYICKTSSNNKVLIVCVEICTIHFQKNFSDDYLLSNSLFGDGCAAILIEAKKRNTKMYNGIKIKSFNSLIIEEGINDMTWQISESGFIMRLSSNISGILNERMVDFLKSISINKKYIKYWAVHPGGKKILDDFYKNLKINKKSIKNSYNILKKYGNMSSPTILFILKDIIENNKTLNKNERIFVVAFGPGLSIESMQVEIE